MSLTRIPHGCRNAISRGLSPAKSKLRTRFSKVAALAGLFQNSALHRLWRSFGGIACEKKKPALRGFRDAL